LLLFPHQIIPFTEIELSHEMMSPSNIHNLGEVDRISLGLSSQRSQRRDEFITTQLTNHLFQTQGHQGLDLAAINIQRYKKSFLYYIFYKSYNLQRERSWTSFIPQMERRLWPFEWQRKSKCFHME
jgi:hypothetical protein